MLNIMVKSVLELQLKISVSCSIQDHPTFGFHPKNADFQLLAIFINTSTVPRVQPMLKTELISISLTDQVPLLDIWDKIPPPLLDFLLKTHHSDKSPNSKVSASLLQSLTVFWVWLGQQSVLNTVHLSSTSFINKDKSQETHSLSI